MSRKKGKTEMLQELTIIQDWEPNKVNRNNYPGSIWMPQGNNSFQKMSHTFDETMALT